MTELQDKRKQLEIMGLEVNIFQLEQVRLLEMDEEKQKLIERIAEQKEKLKLLKGGN
jgi:hypothetical protein